MQQMCDNIQTELKAGLNTVEWAAMAELHRAQAGSDAEVFDGHAHAVSTLSREMADVSSEPPQYYLGACV